MIADRIQVDNIPRIGLPRAEPTTFTYTGATALTPEQYQSQFVNYANQYIGLPSLEKETGISVTAPTVEEVQTGRMVKDDDDDTDSFIKAGLATEDISFGIDSLVNTDTGFEFKNKGNFSTYADYLKGTGKADRVDIVENLYSPIMEGNFKDINLSEADLFSSLRDAPEELREDIKGLSKTFNEQGVRGVVEKYGEPVAKKVLSTATGVMMGPLAGAGLSGILGGEAETSVVTGKPSFRPAGILGAFYDLNATRQFQDVLHIRAVEEASLLAGNYFDTDVGFAMGIGNFGITRRPGASTYTGNRRGMSHKQIKDLEAISKGYLPESYRFTHDKDGQDSFFLSGGTKINQRISDDGGLMVDPNNPMAGFYKGDGTFYSPRFGYSKYGMRKDIQNLADKYGIDTTLAEQALENARAGKGTLAGNIFKIKRDSADKDEKGDSSFVPTPRPPVPAYPFQTTGSKSMDMIQQSIQNKKDRDDEDNKRKELEDRYDDIAEQQNAKGGFIGMNNGGSVPSESGFVDGVPPSQTTDAQEVADDRPTQLPEGAFVLNASSVEFAGEQDISKMLLDAHEEALRRGIVSQGTSGEATRKMIDVAVSRGEVVVAPYMVKIIGLDRLEKINKRGIKDTERKIEENGQQPQGVARGGFLDMNNGGEVASPFDEHIEIPEETLEALKKFGQRKRQRGEINKFMASLSDRDAIMLTLITETVSNITPVEDMEAIAEVIINRRDSDYQDFKNVKTVKEVLKQRVDNNPNKAYQFSGLEPSVLEARLNEVIAGTANKGLKKAFIAASNVTDPEAEGYKRLPYNTLFYTKPGADNQWMRDSDVLEFADQIGPHEFYSAIPMDSKGRLSREFP